MRLSYNDLNIKTLIAVSHLTGLDWLLCHCAPLRRT